MTRPSQASLRDADDLKPLARARAIGGLPYVPTLAGGMVVLLFVLGIGLPENHRWLTQAAMASAVLLAVVLWALSLRRNLFLDIVVLLFIVFVLQRVIVVYFWPDQFDYQGNVDLASVLVIGRDTVTAALTFMLLSASAIGLGFGVAAVLHRRRWVVSPMTMDEPVPVIGGRMPFEVFFRYYAALAIPLTILQFVLLTVLKIGVAGLIFDRGYAIAFRLSILTAGLSIIAFLPLFVRGASATTRKLAMILLALQIGLGVLETAKGAPVVYLTALVVAVSLAGYRIRPKHVWFAAGLLFVTVLLYAPAIVVVRSALLGGLSWTEAIQWGTGALPQYADAIFRFSQRVDGLDELAAIMSAGRNAFPDYMSTRGDLVMIALSYVPRWIVARPDWVAAPYVVTSVLRGWPLPSAGVTAWSGENLTLPGMAFLYYGFVGGIAFMALWAAASTWILAGPLHRIYKILYVTLFVVMFFEGGGFISPVMRFVEAVVSTELVYAVYALRRVALGALSTKRQAVHDEGVQLSG